MTIFEITIIALLTIIMLMVIILVKTAIGGFHDVCQKQDTILGDTMVLKAYFNNLLERFNKITDEGGTLQQQLNDLHVNAKGNYLTLDRQQEDIGYIKMRINHILSLMHPAEEVIKPDAPTAIDGLSNVQKDNANKSTNYNGYDPTFIVKGSEITDKKD